MSADIKAQYQILAELKRVDEKIGRLQNEIERIPQEITKLNEALFQKRTELTNTVGLSEEKEKKLRKLEQDLKIREDQLAKAQDKMMEVKTNEEYQAAMKENAAQKEAKGTLEETVIKLLSEVDEQRQKLKEGETEFKTYETVIQNDVKRLEEDRARILNGLEEHIVQRHAISARLAPEVNTLYGRVASKIKNGTSVVFAENGCCSGCHMKLSPQLFNEILGFKAIHRCQTCNRILILAVNDIENADSESLEK